MFWKKKKYITETFSPYGIPGDKFIVHNSRLKIIIDPPKQYFTDKLARDHHSFDKLLLIHGCETPDMNDIKQEIFKHANSFTKIISFDEDIVSVCSNAEPFCFGSCWVLTGANGKLINLKKDYQIRTRYRGRLIKGSLKKVSSKLQVKLAEPDRAITPGQSAVVYDGPKVLGGGIISLT